MAIKRIFQILSTLILSLILLLPISFVTHKYDVVFLVLAIDTFIFFYKYYKTRNILISFLSAIIFGIFFSVSFWILKEIHSKLHVEFSFYFILSFFVFFFITCWLILYFKKSKFKNFFIIGSCLIATLGFALFLIFTNFYHTDIKSAILAGFLIGFVIASISAYFFEFVISKSTKIFTGLTDYIAILIKPFLIFFIGYLTIALLFGGLYNFIYYKMPSSFLVPYEQISFIDLTIYALDTMTTGGNSAVKANSSLAQAINTANVFIAIIWMTVMLAATIAYTSESFNKISKRHKGSSSDISVKPVL